MAKILSIPAPLFRDPIYDGASDPVIIWNKEENCYFMFYTQRRSTAVQVGFSSIHGSDIGIASSADGMKWLYRGTIPNLNFEPGHNTFWAPEVIFAEGEYHMYVSYITGVPTDWNYNRKLIHYTADNLWNWKYQGDVLPSLNRVIDACIYEIKPHVYKMWFKNEEDNSYTYSATSTDLYNWELTGAEITDCPHEGPNVFELGGVKWMITDIWKGLAVYQSEDFANWKRCDNILLNTPGNREGDSALGRHADVMVVNDEAYIFYFCHPYEGQDKENSRLYQNPAVTVLQAARLTTDGENLYCDRDREFIFHL